MQNLFTWISTVFIKKERIIVGIFRQHNCIDSDYLCHAPYNRDLLRTRYVSSNPKAKKNRKSVKKLVKKNKF